MRTELANAIPLELFCFILSILFNATAGLTVINTDYQGHHRCNDFTFQAA